MKTTRVWPLRELVLAASVAALCLAASLPAGRAALSDTLGLPKPPKKVVAPKVVAPAAPGAVIKIDWKERGERRPLTVSIQGPLIAPERVRLDSPADKFALIYKPLDETFLGLELRDAHWWQFSWRAVLEAIERNKRVKIKLSPTFESTDRPNVERQATRKPPSADEEATNKPKPPPRSWRWRPVNDGEKVATASVAGFEVLLWEGEGTSGRMRAWVMEGVNPAITAVWKQLRAMNEPMADAAARPLVSSIALDAGDTLIAAKVIPMALEWGSAKGFIWNASNRFAVESVVSGAPPPSVFQTPKNFTPTRVQAIWEILDPEAAKREAAAHAPQPEAETNAAPPLEKNEEPIIPANIE